MLRLPHLRSSCRQRAQHMICVVRQDGRPRHQHWHQQRQQLRRPCAPGSSCPSAATSAPREDDQAGGMPASAAAAQRSSAMAPARKGGWVWDNEWVAAAQPPGVECLCVADEGGGSRL